jgi:zinc-ribbon domain
MMHKKNFVAAIKVGGKVLRESSDRVELPFGSEYSVLLKNLDTVRMQAQVSIDGQDASGWLVIEPGSFVNLERFYRGNRDQGNRFKFIERTERIEEHRGVGAEDGLVRIEFKREKIYEAPKQVEHHTYHHYDYYPYRPWYPRYYWNTISSSDAQYGGIISATSSSGMRSGTGTRSLNCSAQGFQKSAQNLQCSTQNLNDVGITVDGSLSNQTFTTVAGFQCEAPEAIVLHLVGTHGKAIVKVAKTVDQKPDCVTCGKKNKPTSKFCVECGTSLEKV